DAVDQLDSVNTAMVHPNVLAIVNGDDGAGFTDLIQVLTGNAYCESGEVILMFREFSEGVTRRPSCGFISTCRSTSGGRVILGSSSPRFTQLITRPSAVASAFRLSWGVFRLQQAVDDCSKPAALCQRPQLPFG